ncbi:MAG: hypothetical protein U1F98_08715 [Verrucomicrobiota bacterium]
MAGPLDNWHWRAPLPQGNSLNNVVNVNGGWLAVGEMGTLLTSSNGTDWVSRDSGVADNLRGCAWGGGTYVVVGDYGLVLTSTDAKSWTLQYPGTFYSLNAVMYSGGQFVAVGEQTTILTSPDGVNWTQRSSGDWELYDVVQAKGLFIAAGGLSPTQTFSGGQGVILSSPDARVWTRRVLSTAGPIRSIAYGQGMFAGYSANQNFFGAQLWTSTNGLVWDSSSLVSYFEGKLFYSGQSWCLAPIPFALYPNYPNYGNFSELLISPDLSGWTPVVSNTPSITGMAVAGGFAVASRGDGSFLLSSNGWDWANARADQVPFEFNDFEYLNGSFTGLGSGQVVLSGNGGVWTNIAALTSPSELFSITWGKGLYVAAGWAGPCVSMNGHDWTNPAPGLVYSGQARSAAFGNGRFVVLTDYGYSLVSDDGSNWSAQYMGTNADNSLDLRALTYGGGRFAAVGDYYTATSPDGTNWEVRPAAQGLATIVYGNGTFVATGYSVLATSGDGTNWTFASSLSVSGANPIAFGDGWFVLPEAGGVLSFGAEKNVWISRDGTNWSIVPSGCARSQRQAAFGDGTFVIATVSGGILQSDPIVLLSISMNPEPQLTLSGPANRAYEIDWSDQAQGPWTALTSGVVAQMPAIFSDPSGLGQRTRFYRAMLLP